MRFPAIPLKTLDDQLRFAIANKRLLRLTYEGAPRIVEPHDYGLLNGVRRLFVFQLEKAGHLDRRMHVWRLLDLPKFEGCLVLEDTFTGTRAVAGQRHHRWDVLYARVDETD